MDTSEEEEQITAPEPPDFPVPEDPPLPEPEAPAAPEEKTDEALERTVEAIRKRRDMERLERLTNTDSLSVTWSKLAAAFKSKAILRGKVTATIRYTTKDQESGKIYRSVGLSVYYGGLRILIPMEFFYNHFPIRNMHDYNLDTSSGKKALLNRINQYANNILGANIQFTVTKMVGTPSNDPSQYLIAASRVDAMNEEIARNYSRTAPLYVTGDYVTADIIRVGVSTITVNIGGLDCTMDRDFITCRYCAVLKDMYKPGDRIDVQIIDVRRRNNDEVRIIVSGVSAELNQSLLRHYAGLKVKDTIIVRVSDIRDPRKYGGSDELSTVEIDSNALNPRLPDKVHFIAWSDDLNVPVIIHDMSPYHNGLLPSPGDFIRVNVDKFNRNGFVHAFFRANYGNPNNL